MFIFLQQTNNEAKIWKRVSLSDKLFQILNKIFRLNFFKHNIINSNFIISDVSKIL